jgi:hypothetical protein
MLEPEILVYTVMGVSLSVSVIQICHWLLNANPRAVLNAGQWSVAGLIGLTPALLLWLVMGGRSTLALMLASFILPALIWGAPRWRVLSASLSSPRSNLLAGAAILVRKSFDSLLASPTIVRNWPIAVVSPRSGRYGRYRRHYGLNLVLDGS